MSNEITKKFDDEPIINLDGTTYSYIKHRLTGGVVFVSDDGQSYLRVGDEAEVLGEVNITRELAERGFPVPPIKNTGKLEDGRNYYTEESIGDRVFGDIFIDETKTNGKVSDASFNLFTDIMERYCDAQFDSANFAPHNPDVLAQAISLANVLRNNPPSPEKTDAFNAAYEAASKRMQELPWGYAQPDLNAFNILQGGIIDFELAGFAPIGYDVVTNAYFGRMWPEDKVAYTFTDEQIAGYQMRIDAVADRKGVPRPSEYLNDFLVLKAIWASSKDKKSEEDPSLYKDFWEWRVALRNWCIEEYLAGRPIDSNQFQRVGDKVTM